MTLRYGIIATEGPHDQAAIGKLLQLWGMKSFNGQSDQLDVFWHKFIPTYPKQGNLYKRMDMPSILSSPTHSVAIYCGEGSRLLKVLQAIFQAHQPYVDQIDAFGIIVDADKKTPDVVTREYANGLRSFFPHIPETPGSVSTDLPRTGIYVLPDNTNQGTLDAVIIDCGASIYPEHKAGAEGFLNSLDARHKSHWRPFDKDKAVVASIVSVLKPGATNTISIAQDGWICSESLVAVPALAACTTFLQTLLDF